ncbi:short-chain dehydrogenase [Apiospora rasikravindrae]|uniref:Short-chain dehydrogenase n=1 Tax=Apiospora rasikravindrae TaxID=990691 RepID=A0ABR1RRX7_9PEZI
MENTKGSILLTGANGGLGCGIVRRIITTPEFLHYHGIYLVRDASHATALKSMLANAPASYSYQILSLDLSRLPDVREVARDLKARIAGREIPPIRALILGAGYVDSGKHSWTDEGFDTAFVANYLGHWLLTMMLLESMDRECGRIVVVGSSSYDVEHPHHKLDGHYKEEKWNVFFREDSLDAIVHGTWSTNEEAVHIRHAGTRRYGVAKMCAMMMVGELQRRLDADPILRRVSIAGIDPGVMGTGLTRRSNWFTRVLLWPIIVPMLALLLTWLYPNGYVRTIHKSAGDVLMAAFEAGDEIRGKLLNGSEVMDVVPEAADMQKRFMVWRDSVKYAQLDEQDTGLAQWQ